VIPIRGLLYYVIRRLLLLIPVLLGVTLVIFIISHVTPSNPAAVWAGGVGASPEAIENIRKAYHLDAPLPLQYFYYLSRLLRGDLGVSPETHRPVIEDLKEYFPNTVELAVLSIIIGIVVGIPLGVLSAIKRDKPIDHASRVAALFGICMPVFWLGLMLQIIFYHQLGWVSDPVGRYTYPVFEEYPVTRLTGFLTLDALLTGNWHAFTNLLEHMVLPAVCLSYPCVSLISRMVRSAMLEVLREDYIRTARAGGIRERVIIYRHALRNALLPTTTVIGLSFGWLLAGDVIVEQVFSWPGIGRYAVGGMLAFDFPALMGFTLVISIVYVLINLFTDILYAYLDPRISLG